MSAPDSALPSAVDLDGILGTRPRRYDGPIEWFFPGHGSPGPDCGNVTRVGHVARPPEEDAGKWHIWETIRTCGSADCSTCFNQPDGYCHREAVTITARVGTYFELQNLVVLRQGWLRRSGTLSDRARKLRNRIRDRDGAFPSEASLDHVRRLLRNAERARGRARVRRPIHVVAAPPEERWAEVDRADTYRALRAEAYAQAKRRGVDAGVAIFHHSRCHSSRWAGNLERFAAAELDRAAVGPHWHILGDGWVSDVRRCDELGCGKHLVSDFPPRWGVSFCFVKDEEVGGYVVCPKWHEGVDWVVRNLGLRKSVRGTAFYCLAHAGFSRRAEDAPTWTEGISPCAEAQGGPEMTFSAGKGPSEYARPIRRPVETVTWFGIYSNGHFRVRRAPTGKVKCRISGVRIDRREVVPVRFLPVGPPPSLSESGTLIGEPDEWRDASLETAFETRSDRLKRLLENANWTFQAPKVPLLDRLAAKQEADRRDRDDEGRQAEQWERAESRASYAPHGPRPLARRMIRAAFTAALREESGR